MISPKKARNTKNRMNARATTAFFCFLNYRIISDIGVLISVFSFNSAFAAFTLLICNTSYDILISGLRTA